MNSKKALNIVNQVLEWKNRKGVWPIPRTRAELELIHEAFAVIHTLV